jgi:hypothetical protein
MFNAFHISRPVPQYLGLNLEASCGLLSFEAGKPTRIQPTQKKHMPGGSTTSYHLYHLLKSLDDPNCLISFRVEPP